jgi:N-methylhydantoinase A
MSKSKAPKGSEGPALGIDAGGTFTDFVTPDGRVLKLPSHAQEPGGVLAQGMDELLRDSVSDQTTVVHGTTVATNALLTGDLAAVGFVASEGFGDVLALGRQNRPDLYALEPRPLTSPPDSRFVIEVPERLDAQGRVIVPLDEDAVRRAGEVLLARGVEAIVVGFLHSWRNAAPERRARRILEETGLPVTASAELVPRFREYERFSTAWANAALMPLLARYVLDLEGRRREFRRRRGAAPRITILRSDGGRSTLRDAAREPVQLVLSGPAGGIVGAIGAAVTRERKGLLTLDMGGTSTDVALIEGEEPLVARTEIAGRPLLVPVLDVHTVGAGGGSIAAADAGGALRVGPASAGARPGPAAYGRGGPATVTDANLVLNRIPRGHRLGGHLELDREAAAAAVDEVASALDLSREACALGILRVAETAMERALRAISLERGRDPRRFALVAFGGAGGLHAASLAASLRMPEVVVPADPGLLSAKGMLHARIRRETSQTVIGLEVAQLEESESRERLFAKLRRRLERELRAEDLGIDEVRIELAADVRYRGQGYELEVGADRAGLRARFEKAHELRFGFRQPEVEIEVVALRARALGPSLRPPRRRAPSRRRALAPVDEQEVGFAEGRLGCAIYDREELRRGDRISGPAVVVEYSATTVVPPGWVAAVDNRDNLVMELDS